MKKLLKPFSILLTSVVILYLLTTPYYSYGYILLVSVGALALTGQAAFNSYLARWILSGLLLGASIMFSGLLVWLVGLKINPVIVAMFFIGILALSAKIPNTKRYKVKPSFVSKSDILAFAVATIAPLVLFWSHGTSTAAVFQIASEGWDNGSHVLMLEDASKHQSYLYGPYSELKSKIIQESNAYPQAWHLATANIVNGFGINFFDPARPIRTMYVYVAAIIAWMVVASFLFTKISWFAARKYAVKKITKQEVAVIIAVNVVIQMIVIWGSFVSGFSNYIGMLTYLCALIGLTFTQEIGDLRQTLLALAFGCAAALCWFLPGPVFIIIAFSPFLIFLANSQSRLKSFKNSLKRVPRLAIAVGLIALTLIQVLIFVTFSTVGPDEQLNTGVSVNGNGPIDGVFHVSPLFFALASIGTILYFLYKFKDKNNVRLAFSLVAIPGILVVLLLFAYQTMSTGSASYYLPKLMGVALIGIGVFASASLVFLVKILHHTIRLPGSVKIITAFFLLSLSMLASNQSGFGAMKLLASNAKISMPVAEEITAYMRDSNSKKQNIIILRGVNPYEDRNGKFETRVVHQRLTCSYTINSAATLTDDRIQRLSRCADKLAMKNRTIVVITSDLTKDKIKALNKNNIIIKNINDKND